MSDDAKVRARAYAEAALLDGMSPAEAAAFAAEAVSSSPAATKPDPFAPVTGSGGFLTLGAAIMRARGQSPVRWVIPRLVPAGLTLWSGPPKIGKSFMALDMAFAVASGGNVLGTVPTNRCSVLYLALEDHARRIDGRLRSLEPDMSMWPLESLALVTQDDVVAGPMSPLMNRWHDSVEDPGMVIIDTLGSYQTLIASSIGRLQQQAGAYQADVQLLRPLQKWALTRNVAVVVIHHTNQSKWEKGDDWTTKASGTSGLIGTADQLMLVRGERGNPDAEMFVTGREIEDLTLDLHRTGAWWMVTGGMR